MILRIALLLVSIPLLAHGAERLYVAASSRTQAQITCDDYFRNRPRGRWVLITGCEVDYVRAGYRESGDRITELLFPVRPAGTSPALPAALVVSTRDPQALAIAEQTIHSGSNADQESFLVMMLKIITATRASRELQGVTRGRVEMLRTRRSLSAIRAPLADDFTILDLHAKPTVLWPALEATAGAQAFLVFIFLTATRRRRQKAPAVAEETGPPADIDTAWQPRALRGIMLLNLPQTATLADVEKAPPLGSADEVRNRVARVLPGIQFNDGRATYNRPDFSIAIDLGRGEPVYTAVVDLEGDGASLVFGRLVAHTGWRAYAPKRGAFVSVGDTES